MYEDGIAFAFFSWLFSLITSLFAINSQMEKNLRKVGYRRSWLYGEIKPLSIDDRKRGALRSISKFVFIWAFNLLFIFTSWLYVIGIVGRVLYGLYKDAGAPQYVKEFRWRMKNVNLTFDQVAEEFFKVNQVTTMSLEEYKQMLTSDILENTPQHL